MHEHRDPNGGILSFLWQRLNPALFERCFQIFLLTNIWLKFKFMSITYSNLCKTLFHRYSYGFWCWFFALSLINLHNCCIVTLAPMSAGQTTCLTTAIPYSFSLFRLCTVGLRIDSAQLVWRIFLHSWCEDRLCTAGLKNLMRVTINKLNALY